MFEGEAAMNSALETPKPERANFRTYLRAGWMALDDSNYEVALMLLRRAAAADFSRPEPWFGMGVVQERLGDNKAAGYCYYMASDLDIGYQPARQALERLGFLTE
jgi:Flp pilus assembly protein TadD